MKLCKNFHAICCSFRSYSKAVGLQNDIGKVKQKLKTYCIPSPSNEHVSKIESVVGLYITFTDVSWAEINVKDREILRLGCITLPHNINQMNLSDLYHVASDTIKSFPMADHYIMENISKNISGTAGRLQLSLHSSHLQLVAMLIALLNSRESCEGKFDIILFMRNRIHGRLYSLLVGSEMVTVEDVISKIFRGELSNIYTPMKCSPLVASEYKRHRKVHREFMGHALLIALSFAELVVYENVRCSELLGFSRLPSGKDAEKSEI